MSDEWVLPTSKRKRFPIRCVIFHPFLHVWWVTARPWVDQVENFFLCVCVGFGIMALGLIINVCDFSQVFWEKIRKNLPYFFRLECRRWTYDDFFSGWFWVDLVIDQLKINPKKKTIFNPVLLEKIGEFSDRGRPNTWIQLYLSFFSDF